MTNKLDVRERILLPADVADFLDDLQEERRLPSRRDVLLHILRDAMRRKRHAVASAASRARRKEGITGSHTVAKG